MFKRKELSLPVFLSVALAIFALLTRYIYNPLLLLAVSGIFLAFAYTRVGRPLKLPRLLTMILVVAFIAALNFFVFVLKVHAEQALVYFLFVLMLARSLSLCKFKDYVQVMSLSALSMLAAGAFNPNPNFHLALLLYMIAAGYWVFKFHLISEYVAHQREKESAPVVIIHTEHTSWIGPFVRTSFVTASIALIIFSLIPRNTPALNFAAAMMGQQFSSTGFGNELTLGEMSKILEDKTPVLRAKYLPEKDQRKNYVGMLYFRGAVYNQYVHQGNTWRWQEERVNQIKRLNSNVTLAEPSLIQPPLEKKPQQSLWRISFDQAVSSNLFVVDRPLAVAVNQSMSLSYNLATNIISNGSQFLPKGMTYQLLSEQSLASFDVLPLTTQPASDETEGRAEDEESGTIETLMSADWEKIIPANTQSKKPSFVPDLRRQPGESNDGVVAITLDTFRPIAEKAIASLPADATAAKKIKAIESWLKNEFNYTLDNRDVDRSAEPVLDFLTRRKHGHCEYFASSLVLLAQSLGYDARVVAGFKDGEYNSFGDYYVVRNCDAHAWSEVLIPDVGWMRFDPTPPAREDFLQKSERGAFKWFWDIVDLMQYSWTDNLDISEGGNRDKFMKGLHQQMMGPEEDVEDNSWSLRQLWRWVVGLVKGRSYKSVFVQVLHFILALSLLGISLFLLRIFVDVAFIAWDTIKEMVHRRWEKRYGLIRYCPVGFYRKLLLWLAVRGVVRQRYETSDEFVNRVGQIRPDIEKELRFITRVYQAVRFGKKRVNFEQEDYIAQMIEEIQQAILTTRVVTREVLVEKPAKEHHDKPAEHSESSQAPGRE
jgi:hypothetical protein